MKTPSRYSMEGKYSFVGTGMVKDHYTGELHEGKLIFDAFSPAIETKEENGRREASLNLDLVRNPESLSVWEIVIMDGEKEEIKKKNSATFEGDITFTGVVSTEDLKVAPVGVGIDPESEDGLSKLLTQMIDTINNLVLKVEALEQKSNYSQLEDKLVKAMKNISRL